MEFRFCLVGIKQGRWLSVPDGVGADDAPADSLTDLRTEGNTLSAYLIPEDDAEEVAKRVATALAAKKQAIDTYDYMLFRAEVLEEIAIQMDRVDGTTPDGAVNGLHWDLVRLSALQIGRLAGAMRRTGSMKRIHKRDMKVRLSNALEAQRLDRVLMSEGVIRAIKGGQ
jgi:hypothetical protein